MLRWPSDLGSECEVQAVLRFSHRLLGAFLPVLFLVLVCLAILPPADDLCASEAVAAEVPIIYYYFPDSPHVNTSTLKNEIELFFAQMDCAVTFQPFTFLADLEQSLQAAPPDFLFLPQGYVASFRKYLNLKPFLVPTRKGVRSYDKIILQAKDSLLTPESVARAAVAMTQSDPENRNLISTLLSETMDARLGNLRIVLVSKDADAIFALALGQVDLALVSQVNFDLIGAINPRLTRTVQKVLRPLAVNMPILCIVEGRATAEQVRKLQNILMGENTRQSTKIFWDMLRIDGWQTFTN